MIRIGVIGTGNIAQAHLRTFAHIPNVVLGGVYDISEAAANGSAETFNTVAVPALEDLWDKVDAVWICTPPYLHAEQTLAAIRAGKHVMCEKPMATTLADADTMVDAARQARVTLMIGQVVRFGEGVQRIHEMLANGELGDLVAAYSHRNWLHRREMPEWRKDNTRGGGVTLEVLIHEVDFVRWTGSTFGGPLERVFARVHYTNPDYPNFDTLTRALFGFQQGPSGEMDGSMITPMGGPVTRGVIGTKGMAASVSGALSLQMFDQSEPERIETTEIVERQRMGADPSMLAENVGFIHAIENRVDAPVSGEDGRETLRACFAILESGRRGEAVHPNDVS